MTDFSFHSIGIISYRLKRRSKFPIFVQDVLIDGAIAVATLQPFVRTSRLNSLLNKITDCLCKKV